VAALQRASAMKLEKHSNRSGKKMFGIKIVIYTPKRAADQRAFWAHKSIFLAFYIQKNAFSCVCYERGLESRSLWVD